MTARTEHARVTGGPWRPSSPNGTNSPCGQGLPGGVAQSVSASRQWVSDELTESARTVADRSREAGDAWLHALWLRTLTAVWGGVALLVIGEAATAIGAGFGRPPAPPACSPRSSRRAC